MQPVSPNYPWENGVKQIKSAEDNKKLGLLKEHMRKYFMTH